MQAQLTLAWTKISTTNNKTEPSAAKDNVCSQIYIQQ
jgi:hypothetical protein